MQDQKLLNKAIIVSERVDKLQAGKPVAKIKDERGLTYTVYKLKQDGTESIAWGQLQELNLGDTVQIGFVEDLGEYEGKTVTYRTIRNFNRDIAEGVVNSSTQDQSGQGGPNRAHDGQTSRDFDKENVGKCQSLFLQAFIQSGHSFPEAMLQAVPAKRLAELVVYGQTKTGSEVAPDIQETAEQMAGEVDVSDVPF